MATSPSTCCQSVLSIIARILKPLQMRCCYIDRASSVQSVYYHHLCQLDGETLLWCLGLCQMASPLCEDTILLASSCMYKMVQYHYDGVPLASQTFNQCSTADTGALAT